MDRWCESAEGYRKSKICVARRKDRGRKNVLLPRLMLGMMVISSSVAVRRINHKKHRDKITCRHQEKGKHAKKNYKINVFAI